MSEHSMNESNSTDKTPQTAIKRIVVSAFWVILSAFVIIQFVPVERTNPPVTSDIPTSQEVKTVLRNACYDCHSNETKWPLYSYVAPASWLVASDVIEGREHMNFSTWENNDTKKQVEMMQESWEEVEEGEMPPWFYTPMHRDAQLSPKEKNLLRQWSTGSTNTESHRDDD